MIGAFVEIFLYKTERYPFVPRCGLGPSGTHLKRCSDVDQSGAMRFVLSLVL